MMRTLDLGTVPDQGEPDFEDMMTLKDIDIEVTAITIGVEMSASAMKASATTTHILRLLMGLIPRVMMTFHNREGPNRLAMDVHTTMSLVCLRVWTK